MREINQKMLQFASIRGVADQIRNTFKRGNICLGKRHASDVMEIRTCKPEVDARQNNLNILLPQFELVTISAVLVVLTRTSVFPLTSTSVGISGSRKWNPFHN
jgi:hypothetical protein